MPLLNIQTNAPIEVTRQKDILANLSATTAEMLGKPESYVMVSLQPETSMVFAGTDEPLAYVELKSLGLPEDKTGDYSATLCDAISQALGINTSRIYIEFSGAERHMWGWDNRTF